MALPHNVIHAHTYLLWEGEVRESQGPAGTGPGAEHEERGVLPRNTPVGGDLGDPTPSSPFKHQLSSPSQVSSRTETSSPSTGPQVKARPSLAREGNSVELCASGTHGELNCVINVHIRLSTRPPTHYASRAEGPASRAETAAAACPCLSHNDTTEHQDPAALGSNVILYTTAPLVPLHLSILTHNRDAFRAVPGHCRH